MKKLTFLFILISGFLFSQEFKITPENYKNKNDETKNFVVLEFENKPKDELFKKVKSYIISNYKGIKNDGYNEIENEQIVLDVESRNTATIMFIMSGSNIWAISNRYEINFKDNKIMIKPSFKNLTNGVDEISLNNGNFMIKSIFNKKGEPSKEKSIDFINSEANKFVLDIKSAISADSEW